MSTLPITRSPSFDPYVISREISGYMGPEEEDFLIKRTFIQHFFAKHAGYPPGYAADTYLDWTQRSVEVQKAIDSSFSRLTSDTSSQWGAYNGRDWYFGWIKEYLLLTTLIDQAPAGQTVITVIDIGAGDFQWGRELAKRLNEDKWIRPGITIQIINVRGESCTDTIIEEGRCKVYYLGNFKVEELHSELRKRKIFVENQVDLIVSKWCFTHLVDPVGTYQQTFNLLRPDTGIFLGHGFQFFLNSQTDDWDSWKSCGTRKTNMKRLIIDTKAPALLRGSDSPRDPDEFIVQRLGEFPLKLSMREKALERRRNYDTSYHSKGSASVCVFSREEEDYDKTHKIKTFGLYGDPLLGTKSLFDWLLANNIITTYRAWGPLLVPVEEEPAGSASKAVPS